MASTQERPPTSPSLASLSLNETDKNNSNSNNAGGGVVLVVDPYSTGCLIVQELVKRGYGVVAVWTLGFSEAMKRHVPTSVLATQHGVSLYRAECTAKESLAETVTVIEEALSATSSTNSNNNNNNIVACLAGGEAGVDLADALSEHLRLRSNGTGIPNRRDKKVQQELIGQSGLRSTRQAGAASWDDPTVQVFVNNNNNYPMVLKPVESAGSDGVKLCHTLDEAHTHFDLLMNRQMVNGGDCPAVLCQEFLQGREFVVDTVSRDGLHKVVMVWVYDKRTCNGAAFCYFGCVPVPANTPEAQLLIPYVTRVLDALEIRHGPAHAEVVLTTTTNNNKNDDGSLSSLLDPCLVELNCRAHGGDGNWRPLCRALTGGYSQVEATVDAFLDAEAFATLPDVPRPFQAAGQEVILVSKSQGVVQSMPGYDVVKRLPSFLCLETGVKVGTRVEYTVDLFTGIGSVILMHPDEAVLKRDIAFLEYLQEINGLFVYETKLENLKRPQGDEIMLDALTLPPASSLSAEDDAAVTSTTAAAAHAKQHHRRVFSSDGPVLIRHMSNDRPELRGPMLVKRVTTVDASMEAVVLVCPYSTGCCMAEEILKRGYSVLALWTKGFTPEMKLHVPMAVGTLNYTCELDEADTLADTVSAIYKAAGKLRVVACLAGGEAGVDLADALSERLKVRTNGTRIPNKRDKKLQQELAAQAGLRSVRQACGMDFKDVQDFLNTEPYPVVLKPVESAGSDGVKLCHSFDEAKEHFNVLMSSQMVNGGECPAVLCQEFLRGKEYVVDHVSREGKHKTVMVWVYDKRPANGSAFVYFGCVPVASDSPEAKILIPYVRRILDALDIKNGPSHGEVMMTNDGPCLVEMNCRAHGGDGNWRPLCRALNGGYSQVESAVDSYLDARQFMITPEKPPSPFKAAGQEVILVSFSRGVVKSTPGFDEIKNLESFVYLETGIKPGSFVDYTIDLFTGIGSVILMHHDTALLERDVNRIRQMERENLFFEYEHAHALFQSAGRQYIKDAVVSNSDRPDLY